MFKQASSSLKKTFMTQQRSLSSLVSPKELQSALQSVKILDGSWHMPNTNRDPYKEYLEKRIVGSQFFGIDTIKDTTKDLPHMLPTPHSFADAVGKLGIDQNDHIVVYDTAGIFSACRVYWTFKVFGHHSISVLNGGLPAWEKIDGPTESGPPSPVEPKNYKVPSIDKNLIRNYEQVISNARAIESGQEGALIIDARPYARFTGEAPEPRAGLSSGAMPGSISIAFNQLVESGKMLDDDKLRHVFESNGVDISKDIITSCGSGITASILYFALERIGAKHVAVYDGSWTEYAAQKDAIIVKKQ